VYLLTEQHLKNSNLVPVNESVKKEEILSLCIANFIGLLIQGYDAGRGLLSNILLQVITRKDLLPANDKFKLQKTVWETLRFDPPVHHTKRIAMKDIFIEQHEIKKGQSVLLVLAAANRDPQQFENAAVFNIERHNNYEALTFGIGVHRCPAHNHSVNMAAETIHYLFNRYSRIELLEKETRFEPLSNVRLPVQLHLSLS